MQMRDDGVRKSNIPNKSNEFIQQEASFWPAIYTLLGVKSMTISAVNTCFWRVKSRKKGCMTPPKTHEHLCMNVIQKLLILGVFTLQDGLVVYTPKIKRQGVNKNSFTMPSIRLVVAHWNEINRGFFYAALEYFVLPEWPHILPKNTALPFKNDIFCCCIQRRKKSTTK